MYLFIIKHLYIKQGVFFVHFFFQPNATVLPSAAIDKSIIIMSPLFSVFVILGSVLIYGVVYFPLFAGLATRSLVGYGIACLYAWMFAVIDIFQTFECELDAVRRCLFEILVYLLFRASFWIYYPNFKGRVPMSRALGARYFSIM